MYALFHAAANHMRCGNYAAAYAQVDELIALAAERRAPYWKALGAAMRGSLFAVTGKGSDAVRAITSAISIEAASSRPRVTVL
jgi:predicted negative regulator of RcsB-dependent stress response